MMVCRQATKDDLVNLWNMNIEDNPEDARWKRWKDEYIEYNLSGMAATFAVICDCKPIGEGTLLFSPDCKAVGHRTQLADYSSIANINALRIRKEYEGKGYISALIHLMEEYALKKGYKKLTIGVEASETRNLAIYLHWGYNKFVMSQIEDNETVLYYEKNLILT